MIIGLMKRSVFPILLVAALLGLLVSLAFLQYHWLGQISDGERERLQKHVQSDTARFAEDFNREIQNAYFTFQFTADAWREKNYVDFSERYDFWRSKTAYPNLIKNFYFTFNSNTSLLLHYDAEKRGFTEADWTEELKNLRVKLFNEKSFAQIDENIPALIMHVYESPQKFDKIILRTSDILSLPPAAPKKYGFLIVEIDEEIIKNKIFPDLVRRYFSESDSINYKLAVVSRQNQPKTIFQTQNETLNSSDATAKLFSLSPNFAVFADRNLVSSIDGERSNIIVNQRLETNKDNQSAQVEEEWGVTGVQLPEKSSPRIAVFEGENLSAEGIWSLNLQHTAGSLKQFITNTRRKNLAISFGILLLLGASVILISLSSQRAKLLGQRQIEFISSVSHEFRTPLAVIYSAGENLADGVAKEEMQVSRYGNLIKGEGKKLSAMVEQILEFAGARSGKKQYDLREVEVGKIIENAIAECQPLIEQKKFKLETEIAENLPNIIADKIALSYAVQNLIVNSIKYGGEKKYLKICVNNGGGILKIIVEDKGIGIAKKDISRIFAPFYRAKEVVDAQIHGNGLGLSLVKQTVEAHGGKITIKSETGKGSKFTIHLPLSI